MRDEICRIDEERCTGCGACVDLCPRGAISLSGGVALVDPRLCRGCGVCLEGCPISAISLRYPMTALQPISGRPVPLAPASRAEAIAIPVPPSALARLAGAVAPVALSLATALGERLLERASEGGRKLVTGEASGGDRECRRRLRRHRRH